MVSLLSGFQDFQKWPEEAIGPKGPKGQNQKDLKDLVHLELKCWGDILRV